MNLITPDVAAYSDPAEALEVLRKLEAVGFDRPAFTWLPGESELALLEHDPQARAFYVTEGWGRLQRYFTKQSAGFQPGGDIVQGPGSTKSGNEAHVDYVAVTQWFWRYGPLLLLLVDRLGGTRITAGDGLLVAPVPTVPPPAEHPYANLSPAFKTGTGPSTIGKGTIPREALEQ